jgi:putative transposase
MLIVFGGLPGTAKTKKLEMQTLFRGSSHRPLPRLIQHTDRGSQYCAHAYRKLLEPFGMQASMIRRGNCFDHAPIESFWAPPKNELVYHRKFATRDQATKKSRNTSRSSTSGSVWTICRRPLSRGCAAIPFE